MVQNSRMRPFLSRCTLALALFLGACSSTVPRPPAWVQDTLYFGMNSPDGKVSAAQWQDFVDREVSPRFPDGLTHWAAQGQWREKDGPLQKEDSRVLQIMHMAGPEADEKIGELKQAYIERFKQSSVLRVKQGVEVEF